MQALLICAAVTRRRWSKPPSPGSRRISSPSRLPTCSTSSASRTNSARRRVPTAGARTGQGAAGRRGADRATRPVGAPFLCDMASSSRDAGELLDMTPDACLSIARNKPSASSPPGLQLARCAVAGWMRDEPWKVEARLAEPDAIAAWASAIDLGGFRRLTPRFSTRSGRSRAVSCCAPRSRPGVRWRRWWRRSALRRPRRGGRARARRTTPARWIGTTAPCFGDRTAGARARPGGGRRTVRTIPRGRTMRGRIRDGPWRTSACWRSSRIIGATRLTSPAEGTTWSGGCGLWSRTTSPRRRGASRRARCEPPGWTTTVRIRTGRRGRETEAERPRGAQEARARHKLCYLYF